MGKLGRVMLKLGWLGWVLYTNRLCWILTRYLDDPGRANRVIGLTRWVFKLWPIGPRKLSLGLLSRVFVTSSRSRCKPTNPPVSLNAFSKHSRQKRSCKSKDPKAPKRDSDRNPRTIKIILSSKVVQTNPMQQPTLVGPKPTSKLPFNFFTIKVNAKRLSMLSTRFFL